MSKSILVIDTPEHCGECPFRSFINYGKWCAAYDDTCIDHYPAKPEWCPLKPAPEKIEVPTWDDSIKAQSKNAEEVGAYMYDRGHDRGYNICIDKILGGAT